ncbi:MAG: hypothetical protein ACM36C_07640 [Acidobacteriota bacterium]
MPMLDANSPVRLLSVQFFRRFFDNDLVSPDGDGHEQLSAILGIVAVPGLVVTTMLLFFYTSPLLSPGERMLTALPHKFLLFGCSVCVMALVTSIEWDALSLDARDHAILGPLPLSRRVIVVSKLAALVAFAGLFSAATNIIPAVAFPLVFLTSVPISLHAAGWVLIIHASISLLASLFGFVAILALREGLRVVMGRRLFRVISAPLQFCTVLALTSALLLVPFVSRNTVMDWLQHQQTVARLLPPLWFVGLEETLTASTVLGAPGMDAPSAGRFWTLRRDRVARGTYHAVTPAFHELAETAVSAAVACAGLALLAFLIGITRRDEPAGSARRGARVQPTIARLLARHPQRQAAIVFTLQTLARSPEHRLRFAGYLAAGAATMLVAVGPGFAAHAPHGDVVPPRLFSIQMIFTFFIVAGLKSVFARPAALPANWAFQLCWTKDERRYRSGVRRAVGTVVAALLLLLSPVHALWLGAPVIAAHFLVGWVTALLAAEVSVLPRGHIPFTCATISTRRLLKLWPAYLVTFVFFTSGIPALERRAFGTLAGTVILIGALAAAYALAIAVRGIRQRRSGPVTFADAPDVTQELGLAEM